MPDQPLLTFLDTIEHLSDFAAGLSIGLNKPQLKRHINAAYQEMLAVHDWPWFLRPLRIYTKESQDDGTLSYVNSTRTFTLSGATLPSWALGSTVYVNDMMCDVDSVADTTSGTFSTAWNPGEDLTGEDYLMYRRWYELPTDFQAMTQPVSDDLIRADHIDMDEMLKLHVWENGTGDIEKYSFGPSLLTPGRMAMYVWRAADSAIGLDAIYRRRPRPLRYSGASAVDFAGTIAVTADGTTATGTTTEFVAGHVGSILRIGDSTVVPTSLYGDTPWAEEHEITEVDVDNQILTFRTATSLTDADAGYVITDPIDLDPVAFQAFLHCCEKHIVMSRGMKEAQHIVTTFQEALKHAKYATAKVMQRQFVGGRRTAPVRLADLGDTSIGEL